MNINEILQWTSIAFIVLLFFESKRINGEPPFDFKIYARRLGKWKATWPDSGGVWSRDLLWYEWPYLWFVLFFERLSKKENRERKKRERMEMEKDMED